MITQKLIITCIVLTIVFFFSFRSYFSSKYKTFPPLTGEFSVGTTAFPLKDIERNDPFIKDHQASRELMIRLWYPSGPSSSKKYPHAAHKIKFLRAQWYNHGDRIPSFLNLFLPKIKSYAQPEAPIINNEQSFPVILFTHGSGSILENYSTFLEELASHGYIVVGIEHPYNSGLVVFPDGRIIDSSALLQNFYALKPDTSSMGEHNNNELINNVIHFPLVEEDQSFVLNQLEKINNDNNSPFYKRFDLKHAGIFGHSLGGIAALQSCRNDNRCKAGISLDGWWSGCNSTQPLHKPFLLINAEFGMYVDKRNIEGTAEILKIPLAEWKKRCQKNLEEIKTLCANSTGYVSEIIIEKLKHGGFCNEILFDSSSEEFLTNVGQINDQYSVLKNINNTIVSFFDTHLKGK